MPIDWLTEVFKYCIYYGDENLCKCTVYYDRFEAFARRRNVASARTAERRLRELAQQGLLQRKPLGRTTVFWLTASACDKFKTWLEQYKGMEEYKELVARVVQYNKVPETRRGLTVMGGRKVPLNVMVPANLYDQLRDASMTLGITKSKLARIALNYAFQIGIERCAYYPISLDAKITFNFTPEVYQKLKELAERQRTYKADIVRSALACFLRVLKPYIGKFIEVNEVKVPAWAVEVLSMVATVEGKSADELIAWAIVQYAKGYAKRLRFNIAELNKALSAQDPQG